MYELKMIPEDFIVKEIAESDFSGNGKYTIFLLKKKNYNSEDAVQQIAKSLHIQRKDIGYAGSKDRNAVTEQFISIKDTNKSAIENLRLKDIELSFVGQLKEPLTLGNLKGNEFIITIRNLDKFKINLPSRVPNYYDSQRFSEHNAEVGRFIVKSQYKEATDILSEDKFYGEKIKKVLNETKNGYVNAIRTISKKILLFYIHAYQSLLWNRTVEKYLEENPLTKNIIIPIVGFGTEIKDEKIKKIIEHILEEEKIDFRDFIIRALPDLSSEGSQRELFMEITDFEASAPEKDDLTKGKQKITLKFSLGKGSYATMAIKYILGEKLFAE